MYSTTYHETCPVTRNQRIVRYPLCPRQLPHRTGYKHRRSYTVYACFSLPYYNCNCFQDADGASFVTFGGQRLGFLTLDAFSVESGLCGMGQLNFYNRSNGVWDFYRNDGIGGLQGTCYSNTAVTSCPSASATDVVAYDKLVCLSDICGQ